MSQQKWNAEEYDQHAAFVSSSANDVMHLLAPQKNESILDLGCGDGRLTLQLQQQGCKVVGIDSSTSMVEFARKRGIDAYVVDGHYLNFHNEFDAVFSNAALHWLTRPELVIKGVYTALKPKGRFVAELGGHGNISSLITAMREVFEENKAFGVFTMPWYFPGIVEYQTLLETEGFMINTIELIPRPTPLESGIEKWLELFASGIITHLSAKNKSIFINAVRDRLKPVLYSDEQGWVADYVRLRFAAVK